jgi:hypothetical protein
MTRIGVFILGLVSKVLGCRAAHFLAIPLLPTPTEALRVDDAGSSAAAALIVLHGQARCSFRNPLDIGARAAFRASTTNVPTNMPAASVTDPKAATPYFEANNSSNTSMTDSCGFVVNSEAVARHLCATARNGWVLTWAGSPRR